jgi:tetratricopeptide (TPR) repeat protein
VLLLSLAARAQIDPDTQAAKRHFQRGTELYGQEKYEEAVKEFTTAKELKPNPAFDYNIGRCYDRLERWKEAADAYERYLAADPQASGAMEIQERIAVLRARQAPPPGEKPPEVTPPPVTPANTLVSAPPPAKKPVYKRAWFWAVIGGGAAAIAVGVALGVTLGSSHNDASHPIMDVQF